MEEGTKLRELPAKGRGVVFCSNIQKTEVLLDISGGNTGKLGWQHIADTHILMSIGGGGNSEHFLFIMDVLQELTQGKLCRCHGSFTAAPEEFQVSKIAC